MRAPLAFWFSIVASAAFAQAPTAEELRAQIDARVSQSSTYQELLNDPDPARSFAAVELMVASGDDALARAAIEFGLLSADAALRQIALEAAMAQKPQITIRFDGSKLDGSSINNFKVAMSRDEAALSPNNEGFYTLRIGEWIAEETCFAIAQHRGCGVTVNAGGLFWTAFSGSGQLDLHEGGELRGSSRISRVSTGISTTARLLP